MKSVCIVGAGPAGLVAAKTFLQHGDYRVTVFEAADRVGGMWRAPPGLKVDKCSPQMRTNLSRFTVAFPDLAWSSVDLSDPVSGTSLKPPMFPKAWQVGRYLATYAEKFGLNSHIRLNNRVVKANICNDSMAWEVTVRDNTTEQQSMHVFDHLIVASGFFDKPARTYDPSPDKNLPNVQHSSQFTDVFQLTKSPSKIVVIGGGISGAEAAAQAALQISDANHRPGSSPDPSENRVHHIVNRPFYCLPRFIPRDPHNESVQDSNLAPTFLPLDLILYELSRRGEGTISAAITTVPPEKAKKGHDFLRSVIGGDQRDLGSPALVYGPDETKHPGYTAITDTYSEFVRSGVIVPVQGWVDSVTQESDGLFKIGIKQYEPWYHAPDNTPKARPFNYRHDITNDRQGSNELANVAGIIEATGYKNNLEYLDPTIKDRLNHDPACSRIPFLLKRGSILADIPTIGFVGFYEGPYWGVMEMQAQIIAKTWSRPHLLETGLDDAEVTAHMRRAIRDDHSLQVPQFWMSDYIGLIEELARAGHVTRDDQAFGGQSGPAFPARYHASGTDPGAAVVVQQVAATLKASKDDARFVAAAVFRAMQGVWTLRRKIDSRLNSPGGVFQGTAHFHPRFPTDDAYSAEYLYIEHGTFTMDTGYAFPATRRYVYRYSESKDEITAWFPDEDGVTTGAFFNRWEFYPPNDDYHGWLAKGHHWCDPDTYRSSCEFRFRGAALQTFGITYQVEGPKKDYSHESWYERPAQTEVIA
jgi:hypothetical protein